MWVTDKGLYIMTKRLLNTFDRTVTTVYELEEVRTVKIYRDTDWNEYIVTLEQAGIKFPSASYHTTDKNDAICTAQLILNRE